MAGLALVALVAIGWRKPARPRIVSPRDRALSSPDVESLGPTSHVFRRRILDLASLGGIAVGVAFVVAIAIGLFVSGVVTNVIERL